jgi:hypothetical protein
MLLAILGAAGVVCPSAASAQAIGTVQVSARVSLAPGAWATLAAATELAAGTEATAGATRLERGLARLELDPGPRDGRRVRVRVDYLRN